MFLVYLVILMIVAHKTSATDDISTRLDEIEDTVSRLSDDLEELSEKVATFQRTLCGSTGWTRVAYLDMSDRSEPCPSQLRLYDLEYYPDDLYITKRRLRACGRRTNSNSGGGCDSITFPTNGLTYSKVCGKVIGHQYYGPRVIDSTRSIDSPYVDGVSITHGSPREHIWTLMAGFSEISRYIGICPCSNSSTIAVPPTSVPQFIGSDYFCESGNPNLAAGTSTHPRDPLWDGGQCGGIEGPCCDGAPWFYKALESATDDDIELRVCGLHSTLSADTPISLYEIYVK